MRPTAWSWRVRATMQLKSAQPLLAWAVWSLLLNVLWKVVQLPFYPFAPDVVPLRIAGDVLHCTIGDLGIALGSFMASGQLAQNCR